MKVTTGSVLALALALFVACSSEKGPAAPETGDVSPQEKMEQAYALLYAVAKPAQNIQGITKIKKTTPAIVEILTEIGDTNKKIVAALESWTEHDKDGVLSHMDLPAFEAKSRQLITRRTTVQLLLSGKKESIKTLLLVQFQALDYQNAMLTIIGNNSKEKGRKKQCEAFGETLKKLQDRVFDQIVILGQQQIMEEAEKKEKKEEKKEKKESKN